MSWNRDISAAPRGKTIQTQRLVKDKNSTSGESLRIVSEFRRELILAVHPDGTVAQSYWIPARLTQSGALLEGNRWSGFNLGSEPIAWAHWPTYQVPASINGLTLSKQEEPA